MSRLFDMLELYVRKHRALSGGWFWRPCPRCGDMFGGNEEFGDTAYNVMYTPFRGKSVCKKHKAPAYCYKTYQEEHRQTVLFDLAGDVIEIIPWDVDSDTTREAD